MRRWCVVRRWQGNASMLVPQQVGRRYWTRQGADRFAARLMDVARSGHWYEVARWSETTSA